MGPRKLVSCSLSCLASWLSGCDVDFYARRLLRRSGLPGKARLLLAGSARELLGGRGMAARKPKRLIRRDHAAALTAPWQPLASPLRPPMLIAVRGPAARRR